MKPLPIEKYVPPELLAPLAGKRVLVTGVNGFVGRWLYETAGISARFLYGAGRGQIELACEATFTGKYDYVLHCTTDGDDLDKAMACLAPGGKMLYLSSGAVYGQNSWPKETDIFLGNSAYANKKIQHEAKCKDMAVIARLFTFIGPGLRRHTGAEFLTANPIKVKNYAAVRSYMYAGDMARWLWTILLHGKVGEAYNVGNRVAMSVLEFARLCAAIRSVDCDMQMLEGKTDTYVPNTNKAELELGLKCEVGVSDAIRSTLEWQAK